MENKITVCVLCYGPYTDLARRCLESIINSSDWGLIADLRIGLNAVSQETADYVYHDAGQRASHHVPVYVYRAASNPGKYPLMRRMLQDSELPVTSPWIMWFDDDSYITATTPDWWKKVITVAAAVDMLGAVYYLTPPGFREAQLDGIRSQLWYTGKSVGPSDKVTFATGGWWLIRTAIVSKWNYPFPVLCHNGGDSILGELIRQQDYRLKHFRGGVAINADARGQESAAPRRGLSSRWPWETARDMRHHEFECEVTALPA